jgi:hypothetical protein
MKRIARIVLFTSVVSLAAVSALARGGGGHGGGGHCGGAHGGGHGGGGHAGFAHGPIGHPFVHGRAICGIGGHFGAGMSNVWWDYLDRVSPTPQPGDSIAENDRDQRGSNGSSAAERDAQFRYDHRSDGD